MKRFSFPLESVLALRLREEEQAQHAHEAALGVRARIEADLRRTAREIEGCHTALTRARSGAFRRDDHLIFLNALQLQQKNRDRLTRDATVAQRAVDARREELLFARRRRETLAQLKADQERAHRAATARAEETALDDLISARHALALAEGNL